MYISEINIKNYRNFYNSKILFNPNINIIIGHNNSGKTNLIKALQLIFNRNTTIKPTIDDFCKHNIDFSEAPSIIISILIKEHNDTPDDKNVVYDWLISESPEYTAQLTYVFELPTKHHNDYFKEIESCKNDKGDYEQKKCLQVINKKFISKYVSKIYGGQPSMQEKVERDSLDRFDFQYLDAIRDAEKQMFFGSNTLLRDVLNYFLDYDLTNGEDFENLSKDQIKILYDRENEFNSKSKKLFDHLINRIDRDKILQYSNDTGANKGGVPNFDAEITEQEILFALRLIVEKTGFKVPIKNNGLGYNNLLFIALILSKMQMESSSYMGDNAKIFPILAIEEPEAHLHPSLQSKFLKFLNSNLETNKQARQIFITSHSTHITSAVNLDTIICLYQDINGYDKVGYPARVFSKSTEDESSKIFVQRFLDATKSNMLFADRIIFVEGLAEQLLIPCFAEYLDLEDELIDNHISIISVDSRTFKHFLKIFFYDTDSSFAINKKVICLTDADPVKKENNRWKSTFPFCLNDDENCKQLSSHVIELKELFSDKCNNIFVFHPHAGTGKTLEYEIAKSNPNSDIIITDSFPKQNSAHTIDNYKDIISKFDSSTNEIIQEYMKKLNIDDVTQNLILSNISVCDWEDIEKQKALIAAIYYNVVNNSKGEHAFYLERKLRDNFHKTKNEQKLFQIPEYIENALRKIIE